MLGVAAMAVVLAGSATAKTGTKHVPQAHHSASIAAGKRPPLLSVSPNALPPKYIIVNSGSLTSPANSQVHGSVSCPAKTVTYGGGVIVQSSSTGVNINSSYPPSTAWAADIDDPTASSTTFFVYAVCAKKNAHGCWCRGIRPERRQHADPLDSDLPAGDKILSGGGFSDTLNTAVNENSTYPTKSGKGQAAVYGWAVDQNNGSTGAANVRVSAVCRPCGGVQGGHRGGDGPSRGHPDRGHGTMSAGKVRLKGGGVLSSSTSTLVNVNSSVPVDVGWTVFENNASASAATFTAFVSVRRDVS